MQSHSLLMLAVTQITIDPATWLAIGVAVLAFSYVILRPRTKKDPLDRAPIPSSLAQQRAVERQMSNLLVELSEMARSVSAGLDTRAAKLQVLIEQADQKIAELQAASGGTSITSQPDPKFPDQAEGLSPANSEAQIAPQPAASAPEVETDPRHLQVYTLADQGRSPQQIAEELQRPRGEIELILALRPRVASAP